MASHKRLDPARNTDSSGSTRFLGERIMAALRGDPKEQGLARLLKQASDEFCQEYGEPPPILPDDLAEQCIRAGIPYEELERLPLSRRLAVVRGYLKRLREQASAPRTDGPEAPDYPATLLQIAVLCRVSKQTVRRWAKANKLPPADVKPAAIGKSHKWFWSKIRPVLIDLVGFELPERFPADTPG